MLSVVRTGRDFIIGELPVMPTVRFEPGAEAIANELRLVIPEQILESGFNTMGGFAGFVGLVAAHGKHDDRHLRGLRPCR